MPEKIVQLNEEIIKGQIKELVCGSVEETLNELLEQGAENYRNVFSIVPRSKVKLVTKILKAIHTQENKQPLGKKPELYLFSYKEINLEEAASKVEDSAEETLTYCDFPCEHWARIRTNNVIERLNREIRHRTRVVGRSLPETLP
mgnify:CR=1 FL=1